jgi:hypothetical protein
VRWNNVNNLVALRAADAFPSSYFLGTFELARSPQHVSLCECLFIFASVLVSRYIFKSIFSSSPTSFPNQTKNVRVERRFGY